MTWQKGDYRFVLSEPDDDERTLRAIRTINAALEAQAAGTASGLQERICATIADAFRSEDGERA